MSSKGLTQIKKFEEAEIHLYSFEEPNTLPQVISYQIVCRSLILARSSTFVEVFSLLSSQIKPQRLKNNNYDED